MPKPEFDSASTIGGDGSASVAVTNPNRQYRGTHLQVDAPDHAGDVAVESHNTTDPDAKTTRTRRVWIAREDVPYAIAMLRWSIAGPLERLQIQVEFPEIAIKMNEDEADAA